MLIVSDTSPLRYLIEVGAIESLPRLYGNILTTPQVLAELKQGQFPTVVQEWSSKPAPWLKVESPNTVQFLDRLDEGEATSLSLAIERQADVLLVDERKATQIARDRGLVTAGTLAVLRDAGLSGMINFHDAIRRLTSSTDFRHTKALIARITADFELAERKAPRDRGG